MRKSSKFVRRLFVVVLLLVVLGFGGLKFGDKTNLNIVNQIPFVDTTDKYVSPFMFVLNRSTGEVVFEKNATSKAYPASLTKIMTAIVALEHIDDLATIAPIDVGTHQEMVSKNSSMAGFVGNEEVTYRDLLYGTILSSGGEAANSLAIHIGGSIEGFVKMMNDKATELGLHESHFMNPEGLHDENQYTTANDMAKLLNYALKNGDFKAIFTKETYVTTSTIDHPEGILLKSTVLSRLKNEPQNNFKIMGGKSGTTYEAGQCWTTVGQVGDQEYLTVVMGAPLKDISHPDQAQIADTITIYKKIKSSGY